MKNKQQDVSPKTRELKQYVDQYTEFIVNQVEGGNNITEATRMLCLKHNITYSDSLRRVFSMKLADLGITDNSKEQPIELSKEFKEALTRDLPKSKYYLITYAQAETEIHEQFWQNLVAFANYIGGEILVVCGRYKSPTSLEASERVKQKEKDKSVWDKRVQPYLYASRLKLNNYLSVLADFKVQPTAANPLNGVNGFTGDDSAIIGSPRVQLKSLPVLDAYPHKLVLSTGAVTKPNFTDTAVGKKSEFEFEYGFVIAEIVDEDKYHVRQVQADKVTGEFYDLKYHIKDGEVNVSEENYPFIVWGDVHFTEQDPDFYSLAHKVTHDLKASNIILHDFYSGVASNPHEQTNPIALLQREKNGELDLMKEIDECISELHRLGVEFYHQSLIHVVAANHLKFLDRWMSLDWRKMPNKQAYLKIANMIATEDVTKGVFNHLVDKEEIENVITYAYGDSLKINGWELGLHYDMGASGSRGSLQQFRNLSTKSVGGHGHQPQRQGGAVMVGTLTKLRLGYNLGLSNWMGGVVIGYPHGKVSHIHFVDKDNYTTL